MILQPNVGIDNVHFGMTELEVIAILGEPNEILIDPEDEDKNPVYQYNSLKLRLTFYTSENNRLLYLRTTHPEVAINGFQIMDAEIDKALDALESDRSQWGIERYFSFNWYFLEEYWLTLHEEFGRVTQVEMGAKTIEDVSVD